MSDKKGLAHIYLEFTRDYRALQQHKQQKQSFELV